MKKTTLIIISTFCLILAAFSAYAEEAVPAPPGITKKQMTATMEDFKKSVEHGHLARKSDRTNQIIRSEASGIKSDLGNRIDAVAGDVVTGLSSPLQTINGNVTTGAADSKAAKDAAIETKNANAAGVEKILSSVAGSFWWLVLIVILVFAVLLTAILWAIKKIEEMSFTANIIDNKIDILDKKVDDTPAKTAELVKTLDPVVITVNLKGKTITYIPQIIEGKYLSLRVLKQAGDASNPAEILRGFKGNAAKLHRDTVEVMSAFLSGEFDDLNDPYSRKQMEVIRYELTPHGGLRIV